jgi:SAM-dependent methyltransferase
MSVEMRLTLTDIADRKEIPMPWSEGEKIPWSDPGFSQRMLKEHLSQDHDKASRRIELIDQQVKWIHEEVLKRYSTKILDLGCGPGLYTSRLARIGHQCIGIDYSPAAVLYAGEEASRENLMCSYFREDIRTADYQSGLGLVMLIFGEFNVFKPDDARILLEKTYAALNDDGVLLLEPQKYQSVKKMGQEPRSWYTSSNGLWAESTHICLQENNWNEEDAVTTQRYYILDCQTSEVSRHASSTKAYTEDDFNVMLKECGFKDFQAIPSLIGENEPTQEDFFVVIAKK